ncbi:MAG TPA: amidohydrolase family protein [Nakamurella sp.]|nr:amidohydrolase family protein [Nakamurella sp.]
MLLNGSAGTAAAEPVAGDPTDPGGPADLVLDGVRVRPHATADLIPGPVAVRDGRIVALGPAADRMDAIRRIRVDGAVAMPGLVDSHTHIGWAGASLWRAGWRGLTAGALLPELARAAAAVRAPHWILGGGWDTGALPERDLPTRQALDSVTGAAPCLLASADLTLAICNTAAATLMKLSELPPIAGGEVVRDADGEPTGMLRGAAARALPTAGIVPPTGTARATGEVASAVHYLSALGVTEIHDIATWPADPGMQDTYVERSFTDIGLFTALAAQGRLPVRVGVRPFLGRWAEFADGVPAIDDPLITFTGLKLFVGGHGYTDDQERPILVSPSFRDPGPELATQWVRAAHRAGIGCSLHALGDGDVRVALDVFQRALDGGTAGGVPHRLVHLRAARRRDLLRIVALGLAAEVQPFDVLEDSGRLRARLSPAGVARLAPYRDLADAGVPVLLGSDWRAAADLRAADPLVQMAAGVLRRPPGSSMDPLPGRGLTPAQALHAAGTAPAEFACRPAGRGAGPATARPPRGRLRVGGAADITVLSDDPLAVSPDDWPRLERVLTVTAGRVTHRAAGTPQ